MGGGKRGVDESDDGERWEEPSMQAHLEWNHNSHSKRSQREENKHDDNTQSAELRTKNNDDDQQQRKKNKREKRVVHTCEHISDPRPDEGGKTMKTVFKTSSNNETGEATTGREKVYK